VLGLCDSSRDAFAIGGEGANLPCLLRRVRSPALFKPGCRAPLRLHFPKSVRASASRSRPCRRRRDRARAHFSSACRKGYKMHTSRWREGPYRMSSRQFGCQVPRKKGKRWRSPGLQAPLTPFLFTERDTTMGWKIKMEETKLKRGWGTYRFRHWKHNTETPRAKHGASELCSQQNSQLIGPLRSELHREPRRKLGFKPAARRAEQPALQPAGRSSPGALCARASAETRAGTLRTCGS
jgi:hypothetical protein